MKSNCRALKLAIKICIITFIMIVIFTILVLLNNECKLLEILLNIFIGLFGSGCIALLLAIPAYNVSKRQLMEKYWQETNQLISSISDIDYLFNKYDNEAVVGYIRELTKPLWQIEFEKSKGIDGSVNRKKYKDMIVKEYYDNISNLYDGIPEDELKQYFEDDADRYVEMIRKKAIKIFEEYVKVSKESTIKLNFMLGDMEFISGEKEYKKIHGTTYQPLYDTLELIKEVSIHFKSYLDDTGEGDEAFSIEELLRVQEEIFNVEIIETEDEKSFVIHKKFVETMLKNLEMFRANMYGIKEDPNAYSYPPEYIKYSKKNLIRF